MSAAASDQPAETFDANRARGRVDLAVAAVDGLTRVVGRREEGSLRVRFPAHTSPIEAVLLNNAGGIAGGDRFAVSVQVDEDAQLVVTTAAAEKVYRSHGPAAELDIRIAVARGATLAWLPQETIVFDAARLQRTISIEVAEGARVLFAEALVLGRSAMGETLNSGALMDRWRVRRGGRLVYADGVRLEGDIAGTLVRAASTAGGVALATVLMVPGNDEMVAALRACESRFRGEVGASAWNGIALARLVARDGAMLRHDLAVVAAATGVALPRLWLN